MDSLIRYRDANDAHIARCSALDARSAAVYALAISNSSAYVRGQRILFMISADIKDFRHVYDFPLAVCSNRDSVLCRWRDTVTCS